MTEEKKVRLFYYEDAFEAFIPIPDKIDGELIIAEDQIEDGEVLTIQFKRVDMTDEEFKNLKVI